MNPMVYGVAAFAAVERGGICLVNSCVRETIRCVSRRCLRASCRQKETARDGVWTDALSCSACER